jgi:dihydrofolate reductase
MALTLDGKIAKGPDHYPDWTGKEDKKLFAGISKKAGVVIMGSKTFDTFGSPLPNRKNVILTRNKNHISELEHLVYTDKKPAEILKNLKEEGYSSVVLAGGAIINSLFAREKLIDEIIVTVSPIIFGYGISLFTEDISMALELNEVERVGLDLVCLKYNVLK